MIGFRQHLSSNGPLSPVTGSHSDVADVIGIGLVTAMQLAVFIGILAIPADLIVQQNHWWRSGHNGVHVSLRTALATPISHIGLLLVLWAAALAITGIIALLSWARRRYAR